MALDGRIAVPVELRMINPFLSAPEISEATAVSFALAEVAAQINKSLASGNRVFKGIPVGLVEAVEAGLVARGWLVAIRSRTAQDAEVVISGPVPAS